VPVEICDRAESLRSDSDVVTVNVEGNPVVAVVDSYVL
jgi:hypothetical protein